MAETDLFDQFQKSFTQALNQHVEQLKKLFQPLTTQKLDTTVAETDLFDQFTQDLKSLSNILVSLSIEETICSPDGQANPTYTTEITNTADIVNTFPSKVPEPTDVDWTRHNQKVDRYLSDRHATIDKTIDGIGGYAKRLLNPISTKIS